jgi:hypothetical protein
LLHALEQLAQPAAPQRRDGHAAVPRSQRGSHPRRQTINLIEDEQLRNPVEADLTQHLSHDPNTAFEIGRSGVDHVQEEVRVGELLEGGAKGLHEFGR